MVVIERGVGEQVTPIRARGDMDCHVDPVPTTLEVAQDVKRESSLARCGSHSPTALAPGIQDPDTVSAICLGPVDSFGSAPLEVGDGSLHRCAISLPWRPSSLFSSSTFETLS